MIYNICMPQAQSSNEVIIIKLQSHNFWFRVKTDGDYSSLCHSIIVIKLSSKHNLIDEKLHKMAVDVEPKVIWNIFGHTLNRKCEG